MSRKYADRADFLTVYIKEAHTQDEWQMSANEKEGVCYPQPRTLSQRVVIANDFVRRFHYGVPLVIDAMDNRANELYAAGPERFYIVNPSGVIEYKGKPGPFGYHPEEVEAWLAAHPAAAAAGATVAAR